MAKMVSYDSGILHINEFDLNDMADNPAVVMIAKRGSGKSWVCRTLIQFFNNIPVGTIIAPTDKMNGFYKSFYYDSYIHYEFESDIIGKILSRQRIIKEKKKQREQNNKTLDSRAIIVMDDCLSSKKKWLKDLNITELLFNGRHYDITYILTMQFPLGITPELRCQFDYVFLLAEDVQSNLKRIYDHYAGMFPTFESFRQIFTQLTDNFGAMVIVNTPRHKKQIEKNNFLNKIFWFKAKDNIYSDIGCKQFRKFHINNFDENYDKENDNFDIVDYCMQQKKNRGTIKIKKINL